MNSETQPSVQYLDVDSNTMRIVNGREREPKDGEENVLKSVGGYLKKGWRKMREGAVKVNRQIKESKLGRKTAEKIEEVKASEFSQRVKDGAKQAGRAIKKGAKKATEQIKSFAKQDATVIEVDQTAVVFISCYKHTS
ncbi:hypothetical protein WA577_002636 [Blastocystis sp. JDR]